MFYTEFISASRKHIFWIQKELNKILKIKGHITNDGRELTLQLKYAKRESLILLKMIYANKSTLYLKRKKLKIQRALAIVGEHL